MLKIEIIDRKIDFYECIFYINDNKEKFDLYTDYWTKENYVFQWKICMDDVISGKVSAFVIEIHSPHDKNIIRLQNFYPVGSDIFTSKQILFPEDVYELLTINNFRNYINKKRGFNKNGKEISEKKLTVDDVIEFLYEINRSMRII